jgi:hypothetical protein
VIESMEAVTCMGHILRTYMGHMARAREHGGCETSRPMPCDTSGPPMEALSLSLSLSHTQREREREREREINYLSSIDMYKNDCR